MIASLRRLNWTMPSPDTFKTREGTILHFGEGPAPSGTYAADPRAVKKWLLEAYEIETMRTCALAKDINCVGGAPGYGREKGRRMEGSAPNYYGMTGEEERAAGIWRRARFETIGGQIVPWLWPMRCIYKAAKKKGSCAAAASMRRCRRAMWAWGTVPTSTDSRVLRVRDKPR